jgi:hypothetical protein
MLSPLAKSIVSAWLQALNHPERLISVAALVVASGALYVSSWQLNIAKQHNILSVRPFLIITPHFEGAEGKKGLYLTNEGAGLGKLTSLSISVSGKTYTGLGANQWPNIMRDIGLEPLCFSIAWPTKLAALRPGVEIEILGLSKKAQQGCELELISFLTRKDVSIELRYTSLYEEEHVFSGDAFMNL